MPIVHCGECSTACSKRLSGAGQSRGASAFERLAIRRAYEKRLTKRSGQPMGFAASGQLIDGHTTVFLPAASGRSCRGSEGWLRKRFHATSTPTAHQAVKVSEVGVDLGSRDSHPSVLMFLLPTCRRSGDWESRRQPDKGWILYALDSRKRDVVTVPAAIGSITGPVYIHRRAPAISLTGHLSS